MIANTLYEYGCLNLDKQQPELAEMSFRKMLTIISESDQDLNALAQYGLARSAAALGDFQEARRLGGASLTTLSVIGHRKAIEVKNWLDSM
jgi:hypothetical protein